MLALLFSEVVGISGNFISACLGPASAWLTPTYVISIGGVNAPLNLEYHLKTPEYPTGRQSMCQRMCQRICRSMW